MYTFGVLHRHFDIRARRPHLEFNLARLARFNKYIVRIV